MAKSTPCVLQTLSGLKGSKALPISCSDACPRKQPIRHHHSLSTLLATVRAVSNWVPGGSYEVFSVRAETRPLDVRTDPSTPFE